MTALGFFLLGQNIDVPTRQLRCEPHVLAAATDRQRQLLIRHHDFDALFVFVEDDLGDFRRRERVHHEGGDVQQYVTNQ